MGAHEAALSRLIDAHYAAHRIGAGEAAERHAAIKRLEQLFQTAYPDGHLSIFGSACNGFGQTGSDTDTVFFVPPPAAAAATAAAQ